MVSSKILKGIYIDPLLKSDWVQYRDLVRKLTERNRPKLFEIWNGYDYYDNEYIKDNFKYEHTDIRYPTIDHKMSIFFGFKNEVSVNDVADISNLCFTKKSINSSKNILDESNFKLKL